MGYNRLPSTAVYNAETTTVYKFDWTLDLDIILSTIDDTLYSVTLWKNDMIETIFLINAS